jgi:hypothetical protein
MTSGQSLRLSVLTKQPCDSSTSPLALQTSARSAVLLVDR